MPARALTLVLPALIAATLLGCGSSSETTGATQSSEVRQTNAEVRAQASAAQRRAVRRRARIRARQAHQAALRQQHTEVTEALREEEAAAAEEEPSSECDPNYSGCLSPAASDYDCEGGSGDGPSYTGTVTVTGEDHYGLDSDSDGIGCEAG